MVVHLVDKTIAGLRNAGNQLALSRDIAELARRIRFKPSLPIWMRQIDPVRSASRDFDAKAERIAAALIEERLIQLRSADPDSFKRLRGRLLSDLRLLGPDLARERIGAERELAKIAHTMAAESAGEDDSRDPVPRP